MLAGKAREDLSLLRYPLLVSPKLDGVRAIVRGGLIVSRNLKPIPNAHVQKLFSTVRFNGLDGELIVGAPNDEETYRRTVSAVMSREGTPNVRFFVFDNVDVAAPFDKRVAKAASRVHKNPSFCAVPHYTINDPDQLRHAEEKFLAEGYEGLMIRSLDGPYKFGRSTTGEAYLLKLKRFVDSEAVVQDLEELMHNDNAQQRDALGRSKRSTHAAGMRAAGTLGALVVQDIHSGARFNIGSGFTDGLRAELWATRATLRGKLVKYKFFPSGSKDRPRFPVFIGFRSPLDL